MRLAILLRRYPSKPHSRFGGAIRLRSMMSNKSTSDRLKDRRRDWRNGSRDCRKDLPGISK